MPAYKVRVVDERGDLIVGATLYCADDASAKAKFEALPLPDGVAELTLGARVIQRNGVAQKVGSAG